MGCQQTIRIAPGDLRARPSHHYTGRRCAGKADQLEEGGWMPSFHGFSGTCARKPRKYKDGAGGSSPPMTLAQFRMVPVPTVLSCMTQFSPRFNKSHQRTPQLNAWRVLHVLPWHLTRWQLQVTSQSLFLLILIPVHLECNPVTPSIMLERDGLGRDVVFNDMKKNRLENIISVKVPYFSCLFVLHLIGCHVLPLSLLMKQNLRNNTCI